MGSGNPVNTARPLAERFWEKVDRSGGPDACWPWLGTHDNHGYGHLRVGSRVDGTRRMEKAHRLSYELAVGPIPDGLPLDHLCRTHGCANFAHIEPVTQAENTRRGIRGVLTTHCPAGHPYDEANTRHYTTSEGWRARFCKACARAATARYRNKKKAQVTL